MHITNEMIHPELRKTGQAIRFVLPYFNPSTFRLCAAMTGRLRKTKYRGMNYREVFLSRGNGQGDLRLCVFSPLTKPKKATGILWIHGGGYGLGAPEQNEALIRRFVEKGSVVVAPDYCLSIEKPYPAALLDCYQTLLWIRDNAGKFGICSDQLMVGGDSAGGGLCCAVTILARERKEVSIACQMPLYPMIDDRMITPSSKNNDAPVWNTQSSENRWKLYLGDLYGTDKVPYYAAPERLKDFTNLPPAIIHVGDIDPFHDETVIYGNKLRKAGILVAFKEFEGCFHGFDIVASHSTPAKDAHQFLMLHFTYAQKHYFKDQPADL